ncbi:hypothetical protein GAY28_02105 [Azospirillum brasilense]|nr:hypothetical protein [Azospirillum brasilense]
MLPEGNGPIGFVPLERRSKPCFYGLKPLILLEMIQVLIGTRRACDLSLKQWGGGGQRGAKTTGRKGARQPRGSRQLGGPPPVPPASRRSWPRVACLPSSISLIPESARRHDDDDANYIGHRRGWVHWESHVQILLPSEIARAELSERSRCSVIHCDLYE